MAFPSPLCWLMTTPGTVSSTSPVRISGRVSSCRAVMAPWLADCATPTTLSAGRSTSARLVKVDRPVTVTSALSASCSVASIRSGPAARHVDLTAHSAEVDQGEGHHGPAGRDAVEAVGAALRPSAPAAPARLPRSARRGPRAARRRSGRGRSRRPRGLVPRPARRRRGRRGRTTANRRARCDIEGPGSVANWLLYGRLRLADSGEAYQARYSGSRVAE